MRQALAICREHGGEWDEAGRRRRRVGAWREAFLRMPYLRDMLVRLGVLADTFETAITWDRFAALPRRGQRRDARGARRARAA